MNSWQIPKCILNYILSYGYMGGTAHTCAIPSNNYSDISIKYWAPTVTWPIFLHFCHALYMHQFLFTTFSNDFKFNRN